MNISQMTKGDFDRIITDHDCYWDSDLTFQLHHPNSFSDILVGLEAITSMANSPSNMVMAVSSKLHPA